MSNSLLDALLTDEFSDSAGFILPPPAMRLVLNKLSPVGDVRNALRRCEISEQEFRGFVSSLTAQFVAGKHLPGDLALAALAVAVENIPTEYATEYLHTLAGLRLAEMPISTRVAGECLSRRQSLPVTSVRSDRYRTRPSRPNVGVEMIKMQTPWRPTNPRLFSRYWGQIQVRSVVTGAVWSTRLWTLRKKNEAIYGA